MLTCSVKEPTLPILSTLLHSKFEHSSRYKKPQIWRDPWSCGIWRYCASTVLCITATIYDKVEDTGIVVIGKDPAAVLLSQLQQGSIVTAGSVAALMR